MGWLRVLNRSLEALLVVIALLGVTGLFVRRNPADYLIFVLVALVVLARWLNHRHEWGLTERHFSLFLVALYLHMLGDNLLALYYVTPYYDKALHLINPAIFTYVLARTRMLRGQAGVAFFAILGGSALLELLEFYTDVFAGSLLQGVFSGLQGSSVMGPLQDTMYDLSFAVLGAGAGALVHRMLHPPRS